MTKARVGRRFAAEIARVPDVISGRRFERILPASLIGIIKNGARIPVCRNGRTAVDRPPGRVGFEKDTIGKPIERAPTNINPQQNRELRRAQDHVQALVYYVVHPLQDCLPIGDCWQLYIAGELAANHN
jgi:hypothetical protein